MIVNEEVERFLTEISRKLQQYRDAHKGKSPAKIFLSRKIYLVLATCWIRAFDQPLPLYTRLFGVPIEVFNSLESEICLSDEEENA